MKRFEHQTRSLALGLETLTTTAKKLKDKHGCMHENDGKRENKSADSTQFLKSTQSNMGSYQSEIHSQRVQPRKEYVSKLNELVVDS